MACSGSRSRCCGVEGFSGLGSCLRGGLGRCSGCGQEHASQERELVLVQLDGLFSGILVLGSLLAA